MTARYVSRADGWAADDLSNEDFEKPQTITVLEVETGAVDTGLLDANGVKIYRVANRMPIGFRPR